MIRESCINRTGAFIALVIAALAVAPVASAQWDFGGYGEMHVNRVSGDGKDQFDIHRVVFYVGYEFESWIRFNSELELEHSFVASGAGGEIAFEQAYVDFLLSQAFNVRFGRVLVPVGITNRKHEPPTFNGVERPAFDRYVVRPPRGGRTAWARSVRSARRCATRRTSSAA